MSALSACLQHWSLCADLQVKKRKRDVANLDDEVKSIDDMSLDEGEIPTDGQNGAAGSALDGDMLWVVFEMYYAVLCYTCAWFARLTV